MKESDWRSKLVKTFGIDSPHISMCWVNDVRYKAGWPDLYTVINGVSTHYELKLFKQSKLPTIDECMEKLQIAVCRRLSDSGARVFCLINIPIRNVILVYSFHLQSYFILPSNEFNDKWAQGIDLV